jgi:hypothetical protein
VHQDAVSAGHEGGQVTRTGISEATAPMMQRAVNQLADEAAIERESSRPRQDPLVVPGEVDSTRSSGRVDDGESEVEEQPLGQGALIQTVTTFQHDRSVS